MKSVTSKIKVGKVVFNIGFVQKNIKYIKQQLRVNPFPVNVLILYPLKTAEDGL